MRKSAAKIAELIPMYPDDVKAVLVSKRIAIDDNDINNILDIVRQHVGFEWFFKVIIVSGFSRDRNIKVPKKSEKKRQ